MYGFPKAYRPLEGEAIEDTLIRDGYPKRLIEQGMHRYCRFLYPEDDPDDTEAEACDNLSP